MFYCRYVLVIISALLLGACSKDNKLKSDLTEYQIRLANVLNQPEPEFIDIPALNYPQIKDLKKSVHELNIKLFELHKLNECGLAALIAERNTSLGRTQYPSRRYLHEVRLIEKMQSCLAKSQDPDISNSLNNWLAEKQQNLPLVWADLIQTSDEIQQAFAANVGGIQGAKHDGLQETLQALRYLTDLDTQPLAESEKLEQMLKNLQQFQLPARLWYSQKLITMRLEQSTDWLTEHSSEMLCPDGKSSQKVDFLNNVFQLFFIQKIQPLAGQLNRYHYQLEPRLQQLIDHQQIDPLIKELLINNSKHWFTAYKKALNRHIKWWQALFSRCNLSPGH